MIGRLARWLPALALALAAGTVSAQNLTIGLSTPITTLDPHFHNLSPNNAMARHVFETLVRTDEAQRKLPGLAESWKALSDTEWEIKLRKGVKWHDGSEFTADDVIATFKRVPGVPNSPASFAVFVRQITSIDALDKHTLRLKTATAHPLLPSDLSSVLILPKSVAETAKTEDFNSGKAMIGTGPFRFAEYVAGDRVAFTRNDAYWGKKPHWAKVQFKMITSAPARVAALLAGDVQMIENVPTADIPKLKKDARVALSSAVSNRLIYLHMDSGRETNSPFVTTADGKPMEANPLRDPRVRRAISKMIDRDAIASRIMEGQSVPAGQLLAEQFFGTSQKLKAEKYDPAGAKKLLAEAGYPNGFGLTLHAPNNRYINDAAIAQAIAQFLTRNGIQTKLETMPSNVFFSRGSKLEFSFLLAGWGAESGDTSSPLRSLLGTYDRAAGMGAANRGRFSDAGLDALITTALTTIDDTKRGLMLAAASEKAIELMGLVPVHYEVSTWGTRKGLSYRARADQYTLAYDVVPAK
ncbi:ABC transporter substrate-binding protein [Burkholderiaceae bacterium FT117]|uniref:ABC transporter substrate-binding protein n=1 Tax=Zeimonas sediminis TaxID=2944268 RepID=UPI002342DD80|nr:ABC transporter substrate-binding protein [Zeimonas sediminis]MCM5571963.1 ABC transporter substrate-binding protein [Zeimonas sediminis]